MPTPDDGISPQQPDSTGDAPGSPPRAPAEQRSQLPKESGGAAEFLRELGRLFPDFWSKAKELGLGAQVVVLVSFLSILGLRLTNIIEFLPTVYALAFLLVNLLMLFELRTTPPRQTVVALRDAEENFKTASQAVLDKYQTHFLKEHHASVRRIKGELNDEFDKATETFRIALGAPRRSWLWQCVQVGVAFSYLACLGVGVFFLYAYARTNASKLGIVRATYDPKTIPIGSVGGAAKLSQSPRAPSQETEEEMAERQTAYLFDWIKEGRQPKGPDDPNRLVVVRSDLQFDSYYRLLKARVRLKDNSLFSLTEGIAFLHRDEKPYTFRRVGFGVDLTKRSKGEEWNALVMTPDAGESLLLVLRIREEQPVNGVFGREPSDYGITIEVVR